MGVGLGINRFSLRQIRRVLPFKVRALTIPFLLILVLAPFQGCASYKSISKSDLARVASPVP
jgi:hypothetical protein